MSKNVKDVVSYFEKLYADKAIYLWGSNGEVITKELCDKLFKTYGSSTYNRQYYDNKLKEGSGRIGADCSGAMCPVSGFDTTAQGYYNKCISKGNITSIPKDTACLVFKGRSTSAINHIGFYLGNGYVQTIEMKSSKENCVRNKLETGGWKWYGIPNWIDYSSVPANNTSSAVKCVDVSSYQGDINWNLVKSSGVNQAILKVIRKDLNPDKKFEQNLSGCKSAGVTFNGVYNYSYATTVAKAKIDAQKVLSVLNGRKCTVWLDIEDKCQQGIGSLLKDIVNAYRDVIINAGYDFGIYTGMSFYNSYIKPYASQIKCDKWWIARYYNGYSKMGLSVSPNEQYNPKSTIGRDIYGWQYTSSGQVPGINGNVDLNNIYGKVQSTTVNSHINTISETLITVLGKINTKSGNLNIRSAPNSFSTKMGSYEKGELIQLIARTSNNWYRTDKGYISGDYVIAAKGKVFNCNKLNMRKEPVAEGNNIINVLDLNDEVYLMKTADNGWYKVKTKDNLVGYVSNKYIAIT